MEEILQVVHDAPIPGQHLTSPFGDRPWQNPAEFSTAEEALEHFYIPRLMNPEYADELLDVIEMGISLSAIANALQLGCVMEGKHSIDVGILIMPVLMEILELIAVNAQIDYVKGDEVPETKDVSSVKIDKIITKLRNQEETEDTEVTEPVEEDIPEEEPAGLMARRAK